jgi:hypothetical protein
MGFICNQDMFILKEDFFLEGYFWFTRQAPKVNEMRIRLIGIASAKGLPLVIEYKTLGKSIFPLLYFNVWKLSDKEM